MKSYRFFMLFSKVLKFFDMLEDRIRHWLGRRPILYALIGLLGIVLIWRGIWRLADELNLNSWLSILIGAIVLLSSGLLVAIVIGDEVLISAWRGRRKVTELSLEETLTLAEKVDEIKKLLVKIEGQLGAVKKGEEKIEKNLDVIERKENKIEREIDEGKNF